MIAATHVLDRGHTRIALVNGDVSIPWCADRRTGVHAAVKARGLQPATVVGRLLVSTLTAREGESIVPALLALDPAPTAVICANDLLALGVLRGLSQRGIRVPDDMALVGYDDDDFAAVLSPPLTTVRQEPYRVGRTAAEILLAEPVESSRRVVFEPELVIRDST
jgi:LacI family transcriptional regulator